MASSDAPPPKVSKELEHAAEDDWKRSVRDAAKHRAVAQMENYEGFKNMVSVAHLRPWHAENLKDHSGPAPPAFAFAADGTRAGPSRNPGSLGKPRDARVTSFAPPQNSMQFDKTWRRECVGNAARWRYLGAMRDEDFAKVFAVDITGATLGEIAEALAEGFERVVAASGSARRAVADGEEASTWRAPPPSPSLARWRRPSSARWTACGARGVRSRAAHLGEGEEGAREPVRRARRVFVRRRRVRKSEPRRKDGARRRGASRSLRRRRQHERTVNVFSRC